MSNETTTGTARPIAVYPGSFDPLTNGHLDLIRRTAPLFERLYVAVAHNLRKASLFTVTERVEMIDQCTRDLPGVIADSFEGLLVEYARHRQARVLLRGVRAVSDFDFEFQMALMNRRLAPEVETVFALPSEEYSYVSSSLVKEVASFGGDVAGIVPPLVLERLLAALNAEDKKPVTGGL